MGPNPLALQSPSQDKVNFDPSETSAHGSLGYRLEDRKLHLKATKIGVVTAKSGTGLDLVNLGTFEQLASLML
jgi:hypothetical protein